jgi:Uma2 family endonuclease
MEEGERDVQTAHGRKLTYDDFVLLPDDGLRHEIIDGRHYVTPSPSVRHQELVGRLYFEIEHYLRQHPGTGRVFMAPLDVVFTYWDVVEPDLLFVAADQGAILSETNVQGAPALVIEVLSPGTRKTDEHAKRRLFDRGGVREYWLVDPDVRASTIVRRAADGSFPVACRLSAHTGDTISTPLLPGFSLRLVDLFA